MKPPSPTAPKILAIDTSCDDTSVAVTQGKTVLANVIASQTQLHAPYGGVFPTVAKQAHKENIEQAIKVALQRAGVSWTEIGALGVTQGPGLAPALEVGIKQAKKLATKHSLPLIAINHIEGHALSVLAQPKPRTKKPRTKQARTKQAWPKKIPGQNFPALAIVVSGGHTQFIKVTQLGKYQILGSSIDDAAGEALDKVGRMLSLGYPAGPIMEQFAKKGDPKKFKIPLPMTDRRDFNMSFSGLKTWARNKIEDLETRNQLDKQAIYDFTASFQRGVFGHICYKLNKLLQENEIKEVWLGGGVAANIKLRRMIRETLKAYNLKLFTPYTKRLCMDNAAMIGIVAGEKFERGEVAIQVAGIKKNPSHLDRKPRWEIGENP